MMIIPAIKTSPVAMVPAAVLVAIADLGLHTVEMVVCQIAMPLLHVD